MTHNQVAYWDMVQSNAARRETNRINEEIGIMEANTNRYNALRNEYWTHKNYNWNEGMFGYQLFKDFAGMIGMAMLA